MGWLSSAVEQGPATLQCNDLKGAVLHIEEQVISAAHAVVGEELATNSEAEGNQPLQGAGNLERLVWLALHYNSRNRPSSIAAFEDGDTSVKCVCVCGFGGFLQESTVGQISQLLLQCFSGILSA